MKIYFGNIQIEVHEHSFNLGEDFNLKLLEEFLHQPNGNTFIVNLTGHAYLNNVHAFCNAVKELWPMYKNSEGYIKLYIYRKSQLIKVFEKYIKIVHACGGLVYSQLGYLLMQRHGIWDLPKGKLEKNESFEECALREVEEETGVKSKILEFLLNTYHAYDTYGDLTLKVTHWYRLKASNLELIPQIEENVEKLEWIKAESISVYRKKVFSSLLPVLDKV